MLLYEYQNNSEYPIFIHFFMPVDSVDLLLLRALWQAPQGFNMLRFPTSHPLDPFGTLVIFTDSRGWSANISICAKANGNSLRCSWNSAFSPLHSVFTLVGHPAWSQQHLALKVTLGKELGMSSVKSHGHHYHNQHLDSARCEELDKEW